MKTLFKFTIHSIVDIITNSSSELFVLKGKTNQIVKDLIERVYPNYLSEYAEPILISEMSSKDVEDYLSWTYTTFGDSRDRRNNRLFVIPGFEFDDMYEEEESRWSENFYYRVKEDFIEKNRENVIQFLDPENNTWLMYSLDENPNWDFQEMLMRIGERHHLG